MAKFCTKCGKKLEEGKVCKCDKEKNTNVEEVKQTTNKKVVVDTNIDTKEITNNVLEIVKGIFIKPVETCKKYATIKNINLGYILLALSALASALFITFTLSSSLEEMNKNDDAALGISFLLIPYMNDDYDGFEGPLDNLLEVDKDEGEITINTVPTFIYATIIVLLESLVLIGALYIVQTKLMKKSVDFKKVLVTVSLVSAINIAVMLTATVLTVVLPSIVMFLLALGSLYFIITLYQVTKNVENLDENKYPLMFVTVYAILAIVVYVILQLI